MVAVPAVKLAAVPVKPVPAPTNVEAVTGKPKIAEPFPSPESKTNLPPVGVIVQERTPFSLVPILPAVPLPAILTPIELTC